MTKGKALQDCFPQGTCYGCGPDNPDGLHIKSYWSEEGRFVVATYHASSKYNAGFPNTMYGGMVASLIDCHSIWTAMAFAWRAEDKVLEGLPGIACVTGKLTVNYLKPTPLDQPVHLKAWVEGEIGRKIRVLCELGPAGEITATGDLLAVQIKEI